MKKLKHGKNLRLWAHKLDQSFTVNLTKLNLYLNMFHILSLFKCFDSNVMKIDNCETGYGPKDLDYSSTFSQITF
jgi:hypothetical protein